MSIPLHQTHAASYHAREVGAAGPIADGVWSLPIPLRGSPLRSIIVYLVETSQGLVLIDAGYTHPSCWSAFQRAMRDLGHDPASIVAVLLTHNHPDHVGFADQVRQLSGARVMMHRDDDFERQRSGRGGFLAQLRRGLDLTGAPAEVVEEMYREAVGVAHHAEDLVLDEVIEADRVLSFGDTVVEAIHTPGHTFGHTVYVARGALFTGDTMMAEGPTQLAISSLAGDDPAGDLLRSLARIERLAAERSIDLACPAHQYAYRGVAQRAAELRAFHAAEVAAVRDLLDSADTAWEVAPRLTWARPWAELGTGTRRFALMHTLALLQGARG